MYSIDTYTEDEFKLMTRIYPKYKRFEIIDRDEYDNLVFACKLLDKNGLCSDYKHRLKVCRNYPNLRINSGGQLHKRCGYKIIPEKNFNDYLKQDKL
jgi:Fe-S-cluster containining protein